MKKYVFVLILFVLSSYCLAQVPGKFTYQAVVRSVNNSLIENALVGVRISILQGSITGNAVYIEIHDVTTNNNGLLSLEIGGGYAQLGSFIDIDWSSGPYYLKTEIDPNGGTDYSITNTQQLLSVPYALYADKAGNVFSGDYNDLSNTPLIPDVPNVISAFTNDIGYITMDSIPEIPIIPTNVSAFVNDVPYLTSFTEQQILSISNDTVFLTGGSFVKLPEGFDGDYNSLNNKPELFSGDYNDLINKPEIPSVPDSVSAFQNDVGYITVADLSLIMADVNNIIDSFRNRIAELEQPSYRKDYSVDLQILTEGFDSTYNWFQPRVAFTGVPGEYSLIMQPWIFSTSDYFGIYHEMHTYNKGSSWTSPVSLMDSLGEIYVEDTLLRIADVNSQYHAQTNKILAIGGVCRYLGENQIGYVRNTCYFSYDPQSRTYSSYKILQMPNDTLFQYSYPGCSQWVELDNGQILQPFRMWDDTRGRFYTTVARCTFDGDSLFFNEYGNVLDLERGRGLYEPSLIEYNGRYYLTMRNDANGVLSVSDDGLHYSDPIEWKFDTDSLIYSVSTQQHWVKSPWGLYLVYTSANRQESGNVLRGRAPLFMAKFDEQCMCLIKETERILVPNKGAQLGNFGAFDLNASESWVVTSEATTTATLGVGDNNARVYIAKIKWY